MLKKNMEIDMVKRNKVEFRSDDKSQAMFSGSNCKTDSTVPGFLADGVTKVEYGRSHTYWEFAKESSKETGRNEHKSIESTLSMKPREEK